MRVITNMEIGVGPRALRGSPASPRAANAANAQDGGGQVKELKPNAKQSKLPPDFAADPRA